MLRMYNPPPPGIPYTGAKMLLPELKLTVTEAARQLGISRVQLSPCGLNERGPGITAGLALRLEQWINGLRAGYLAKNAGRLQFVAGQKQKKTTQVTRPQFREMRWACALENVSLARLIHVAR